MKCQFCGQDLPYGAQVCPRCGQPVRPVNSDYNQGGYYSRPPKKNGTLIAVIILAIVIVAAIVIGLVFALNNKSEDEPKNGGNTVTDKDKDNNDGLNNYVENSKKESFIDLAMSYVYSTRTKVNEGRDLQLFSTDTLYLIPVGDKYYDPNGGDSNVSCVAVESNGKSPFSNKWNYAYVGVIYNGMGYEYFFVAEDGAGYGLTFMTVKEMSEEGVSHIYSSTRDEAYKNSANNPNMIAMTSSLHDGLVKAYRDKTNHITGYCDVETPGCTPYNLDTDSSLRGQTDMLTLASGRYQIKIYGTCREKNS